MCEVPGRAGSASANRQRCGSTGGIGWRRPGGAVGGEMQLVRLDQVLGLSACAVDLLVERFGDDEAAVGALGAGLDASDDAALDLPACRRVTQFAVAAHFVGLAVDPPQRGILGKIA